jgi:N-carbamoylputrescine amidase
MKIGIIQQHNVEDVTTNRINLETKIRQLAKTGAELIVLQELHN